MMGPLAQGNTLLAYALAEIHSRPGTYAENSLAWARRVRADTTAHPDTILRSACEFILQYSDDPREKASANDLLVVIRADVA